MNITFQKVGLAMPILSAFYPFLLAFRKKIKKKITEIYFQILPITTLHSIMRLDFGLLSALSRRAEVLLLQEVVPNPMIYLYWATGGVWEDYRCGESWKNNYFRWFFNIAYLGPITVAEFDPKLFIRHGEAPVTWLMTLMEMIYKSHRGGQNLVEYCPAKKKSGRSQNRSAFRLTDVLI